MPPSDAGTDQETAANVSPGVADTPVGAVGTVRGVTAADGTEPGPGPIALAAVTANVEEVPLARLETVHESGPEVQAQVLPSGLEVTV
jgi:hypothetical protein